MIRHRVRPRTLVTLLVLSLALSLSTAAAAAASPAVPTMGLAQLRGELAAAPSGTLTGHFKTVLRGSTIENVPLAVLAVTGGPTDDPDPETGFVLFEAYGPKIEQYGGIASGMSGSPVYVNVRGADYLVGALSYGETFTRGGMALATPIEAMVRLEAPATASSEPLERPVITASGVKSRIVVGGDPGAAAISGTGDAAVMSPLAAIYIGGVDPRSNAYAAFAEKLRAQGLAIVPLSAPLQTGSERFTTPFLPGSSLAVLAARGDLWVGALGTVTYTSGSNVLAFGHPLTGEGDTELYLSNAWVDGVWPSIAAPHKIGTPGALRGTLVRDRLTGVMGRTGATPDDVVVTAFAQRSETGASNRSQVALPSRVLNSYPSVWEGIAPFAASIAPTKVYDDAVAPGSALTTTTMLVTDGVSTRLVTRTNVIDSDRSIPSMVAADVADMVGQVQTVIAGGVTAVRILSVDVTATISSRRGLAQITDVEVPGGIRQGDNRVIVSLREHGRTATRTVEVTLTIPPGTALTGSVTAMGGAVTPGDGEEPPSAGGTDDRRSLDQLVKDMESRGLNNQLTVSYSPSGGFGPMAADSEDGSDSGSPGDIAATLRVPWVLAGAASKSSSSVSASSYPARVAFGSPATVMGGIQGGRSGTVELRVRSAGEVAERIVATVTVAGSTGDSGAAFSVRLPRLYSTSWVRVVYSGDSDALGSQMTLLVPVATSVALRASDMTPRAGDPVTLTAAVRPADFGGRVVFERLASGKWRTIAVRSARNGTASVRFTPSAGTVKVRARTVGSPRNAAGASRTVTLRVR